MAELLDTREIGHNRARLDGRAKVTGTAHYAYDQPVAEPAYLYPLQSTIARGRIEGLDTAAAEAIDGVLAVLTHRNAGQLADTDNAELAILQSDEIAFRGQFVGAVIAQTPQIARHAAGLVRVDYSEQAHDALLRADHQELYTPESVNPAYSSDSRDGDVDGALESSAVVVDQTYTTPMEHNNPMEPHTTVATWEDHDGVPALTLYDSTQGVHSVRAALAPVLGLDPDRLRVIGPHVGGGFGSKGMPHAHDVLAALAARLVPGRAVKLAMTRQQMFTVVGYRTPTIQHVRLGAETDGTLTAISHDVVEQTSKVKEFAEQTAVGTRMMYAAPNRFTNHRLAALDVPVNSWMRAPGEAPGMFGPEVAMDELAVACGLDPIELRARNEPVTDPESGKPWSGRRLIECLRLGAEHFGFDRRDPTPRNDLRGGWLVGTGVSSATYPGYQMPGSVVTIRVLEPGRYTVEIGAADIGTGTWTTLTQIAADALGCPADAVDLRIGDTDLPKATVAGGSSGISSWGSAIVAAADAFLKAHGDRPEVGADARGEAGRNPGTREYSVHSFGAQFAEVRVHADTGEVRVPRMLGVFSVGRVINPRTARSQFVGGMTMGLSMALHEHSVVDPRFGHVVNHDFAEYHIPTNADARNVEAMWLDESDPHANPMGSRGIGEIGIVGTAAAVANAAYHATGTRVRDLPITAQDFVT